MYKTRFIVAFAVLFVGLLEVSSQTVQAFGDKYFYCEGHEVLGSSQQNSAITYDAYNICPVRVRWRFADGTVSGWKYANPSQIANASPSSKAKIGGGHGAQRYDDSWVYAQS